MDAGFSDSIVMAIGGRFKGCNGGCCVHAAGYNPIVLQALHGALTRPRGLRSCCMRGRCRAPGFPLFLTCEFV